MKRFFALLMILCLLLAGCTTEQRREESGHTFYYLQKNYEYGPDGSVLAPEKRDIVGERRDLSYVMALYLMGPAEEEHAMPLPAGTRIYCTQLDEENIRLDLSEAARVLSDSEFTLASACLSMTCFANSDAGSVEINNGERSMVLVRGSITLYDDYTAYQTTEEQEA